MTLHETEDIIDNKNKNNNKTIGKWGGGGASNCNIKMHA